VTSIQIFNKVNEVQSLLSFTYNGKDGNIDPYYSSKDGYRWLLYFDGNEQIVCSKDEILQTPFIDGHSLNELASSLTNIDW
jgi:hypothetical protein